MKYKKIFQFKNIINKIIFILLITCCLINLLKANNINNIIHNDKNYSIENFSYMIKIPKNYSEKFSTLLIQDFQGRIKPINTISLELLRKIYKKNNIGSLNSDQWIISMIYDGWLISHYKKSIGWMKVPFIYIGKYIKKKLYDIYSIKTNEYISLMDLYMINNLNGNLKFILDDEYKKAFQKNPMNRNNYEKDLIILNERINIILGIFQGKYLRIFPTINNNNTWLDIDYNYHKNHNSHIFTLIKNYFFSLDYAQNYYNWDYANNILDKIKQYQNIYGKKYLPSKTKIQAEIIYNKLNIFYNIMFCYLILGLILLIISFIKIFSRININFFLYLTIILLYIIFGIHTIGLLLRSYISEHPPWSNGYEASIFISWCSIFVGLLFFYNKNTFILSVVNIISFIILIISHSNLMDPQITNLVPVLKSYWLMIHVSVITSSYGFLTTSAFLGLIVIILYIIKGNNKHKNIDLYIKELTIINYMITTVGLFLLTIGTFLGAIWANESWGRYWSWDPKETWALISIMIYAFVLHIRLISKSKDKHYYYFNLATFLALGAIIMTFFGVNYYLSGLHSYAKGDPVNIPLWIYYTITLLFMIIGVSYYRIK